MSDNSITTLDHVTEQVVIGGDLSKLTPEQRVNYYRSVCNSLGLNPLTRPFDYITLNGKLTLYARKDAAEQLRKINGISIDKPDIRFEDEWIIVTISAIDDRGRKDSDVGVVNRKDMQGNFGNALMKAITKAKRRVTLSISGLGMLDETEVDTIPGARVVPAEFPATTVTVIEQSNNGHKHTLEENLEDLGFEAEVESIPFEPKMDIETAKAITTSKGDKYGDLDRDAWLAMDRNITIKMKSGDLTPEQREEYQYKLDALAVLINS